ncbi:hypothetical protein [Terracoccus sp. 273MFTsu3.1]|uniref:hypothetical protein n=1 Tax=Terracoccus sp. 273MFTsu3.1 TaxID=1172188 RepID=UPI0003795F7C|nr:hypothetical protein [Terracoccus sp. 273MFTsu3.1]
MERDADRPGGAPDAGASLAAGARAATLQLVADATRVGPLVHGRGVVGRPVPVRAPEPVLAPGPVSARDRAAEVAPWFVPVTTGERLVGFALVDVATTPAGTDGTDAREPAARIRRWSTFQRHEGDLASCPPALLWTDPQTITATATAAVGADSDAHTGEPVLTWERTPEHLVWEVSVDGRTVHVAGSTAWPA